jgi:hypothetical protein
MCVGFNFLAVNGQDVPFCDEKNSGHDNLKTQLRKKDDKLSNRGTVSLEVHPCGSLISQDIKDWFFKVDEEGTLPIWFDTDVWKTRCIDKTLEIVAWRLSRPARHADQKNTCLFKKQGDFMTPLNFDHGFSKASPNGNAMLDGIVPRVDFLDEQHDGRCAYCKQKSETKVCPECKQDLKDAEDGI